MKRLVYKVKTEQEGIDGLRELESLDGYISISIQPLGKTTVPYEITLDVDADRPSDLSEALATIETYGTLEIVEASLEN